MLRKRTSFKPNLKQASSQPPEVSQVPQVSQVNSTNQTNQQPAQSTSAQSAEVDPNGLSGNTESEREKHDPSINQVSEPKAPEVSNERVQEAITQLTGQKFEPIKSLSLRSSANKNVKLKDLLFFNPPMTKDQKRHKKSVHQAKKKEQKKNEEQSTAKTSNINNNTKETDDGSMDTSDAAMPPPSSSSPPPPPDEHSLVPKVKMGPDGKLILDESSTIINRKNSIKEQEVVVEDNEDIISRTNYDSFRRKPSSTNQTKWSLEDTKKFYHALTILGTDFSMMESLLFSGHRSRTELHKKFKREERINKLKVDIALSNRISLNSEELDDLRDIFYK